jgi:multiple sugar transport system substrate-binding protein
MSISRLLALVFILLVALSAGRAVFLNPGTSQGGRSLVWVSGSNPVRQAQIAAFNREHPDLSLGLDVAGTGAQKIILQCASGVGPDIIDIYYGEQLQTYVDAGVLWDVTEAARAGGFAADERTLWPSAREEVVYEGRQYAYPCNLGADILLYNKNVFDQLGLPYPQGVLDWEAFRELGARITAGSRDGAALYPVTGMSWTVFFESMGGQLFHENGRLRIAGSPELTRALEMHRDYIFKHRMMPSAAEMSSMSGQGGWGAGSMNQFASGRFAMIVTGEWAIIGLSRTYQRQVKVLADRGLTEGQAEPALKPLRLGAVLIPRFADRPPCYRVRSRSAGINAASPNREEALQFLKFLSGASYSEVVNRETDSLPGNPQFAELGIQPGPPALARLEMHELTKEALRNGYTPRRSPFISTSDAMSAVRKQVNRLENNPGLEVPVLLAAAQAEMEKLIARNLSRDPQLREQYERAAAQP